METKLQKEFIDTGFGFPIRIRNVPMIKIRGVWTPQVNYNRLTQFVLKGLAFKSSRLTGAQIKFIRTHFEMTLQDFATRFCVSHAAVIKWEKSNAQPTAMNWSTEKDMRMFTLTKLNAKPALIAELYNSLESMPDEKQKPMDFNLEDLAA